MRKRSPWILLAAALAVIVCYLLFFAGPESKPLTDTVRETSGSDFILLSEGWTQFELAGPPDGEPLILVHGFSVPMDDWDFQVDHLAAAGFHVLRYNHFGRALSDRPPGSYDTERFVKQLRELMDAMGWEKVHLVVHSMGGAVASGFALAHPEAVDRLVLISPVRHMARDNGGIRVVRIPVVGDLMARAVLPGVLSARAEKLFTVSKLPDAEVRMASFREQTLYYGFARSVKSLFRGDMVDEIAYQALDGSQTLLIWGEEDSSVPADHIEEIRELLPDMETVILGEVGHSPNLEVPGRVNALIEEFLKR